MYPDNELPFVDLSSLFKRVYPTDDSLSHGFLSLSFSLLKLNKTTTIKQYKYVEKTKKNRKTLR